MCPLLLACNYIRTRMCGNPVHLITDSMASHHKMIITGLILSIAMQWTLSTGKELLLFKVKEWQGSRAHKFMAEMFFFFVISLCLFL